MFKLDVRDTILRARQLRNRIGDVTLNLPFVSISVNPDDVEKDIAREIIIRMNDKRVLSGRECCDGCIESSLASLREIRALLVDKQVALSNARDSALFLLLDLMALGIRQFATYEELIRGSVRAGHPHFSTFVRPSEIRESYFAALEILRGHLSRCIVQVAALAGMPVPTGGMIATYEGAWDTNVYTAIDAD